MKSWCQDEGSSVVFDLWNGEKTCTRQQPQFSWVRITVPIMRPCPPTVWLPLIAPPLATRILFFSKRCGGHCFVASQFSTLQGSKHWKPTVRGPRCKHKNTQVSWQQLWACWRNIVQVLVYLLHWYCALKTYFKNTFFLFLRFLRKFFTNSTLWAPFVDKIVFLWSVYTDHHQQSPLSPSHFNPLVTPLVNLIKFVQICHNQCTNLLSYSDLS